MAIQIFGTKKCKTSQKALRFFKERGIEVHFVDLKEKAMSKGELKNVSRSVPLEELIDTEGKEYEKRGLKYIQHDIEEILLEEPMLLRTPVARNGSKATVGYAPDTWKEWVKEGKK